MYYTSKRDIIHKYPLFKRETTHNGTVWHITEIIKKALGLSDNPGLFR